MTEASAPLNCLVIMVCAWCQRVKKKGEWVPITEGDHSLPLSHGMCPDCYQNLQQQAFIVTQTEA